MGTTLTPILHLIKPDEAELAENWVNGPNYNINNNGTIETATNVVLNSYNPTIIGSGGNPSVGAGSAIGEYQNVRGFIFGRFKIIFTDPGVVPGTGALAISLPVLIGSAYHTVGNGLAGSGLTAATGTFSVIGDAYIHDSSTPANCGLGVLDVFTNSGTSYVRIINETIAGKTSGVLNGGAPFGLATGDALSGWFFYGS